MLFQSAVVVAGPYMVQIALDEGIAKGSVSVLRNAVLVYLLITLVRWVSLYWRLYIMSDVGQTIIFDIREKLFGHIQNLSLNFFSRYSVGRLITRVINDVNVFARICHLDTTGCFPGCFCHHRNSCFHADNERQTLSDRFQRSANHDPGDIYLPQERAKRIPQSPHGHQLGQFSFGRKYQRRAGCAVLLPPRTQTTTISMKLSTNTTWRPIWKSSNWSRISSQSSIFLASAATGLVIWLGGTAVLGQEVSPWCAGRFCALYQPLL